VASVEGGVDSGSMSPSTPPGGFVSRPSLPDRSFVGDANDGAHDEEQD
jgi:hypothetical protein